MDSVHDVVTSATPVSPNVESPLASNTPLLDPNPESTSVPELPTPELLTTPEPLPLLPPEEEPVPESPATSTMPPHAPVEAVPTARATSMGPSNRDSRMPCCSRACVVLSTSPSALPCSPSPLAG